MVDKAANWSDDEPLLSETAKRVTARLLRRSRRTWPIWFGIIFIGCSFSAVWRIRHPPLRPAEVVIRLVEGSVQISRSPLNTRMIRSKIFDVAFSRPKLLEVIRRHKAAFPRLSVDPVAAVDDLLSGVAVIVSQNDFVQYRQPDDPPRSVKITVSFKAPDPQLAWEVARDLADLVVDTQVAAQRREVAIEATAAREAGEQGANVLKSLLSDRTERPGTLPGEVPYDSSNLLSSTNRRLAQAQRQEIGNRLLLRAVDEKQALHLELVDPGRPPVRERGLAAAKAVFMAFPLLLLVTSLAVGAFDPRVLDEQDLHALGIPALGHVRRRPRV